MVYHNNIMYIDLIGDVDIKELESKLKSFKDCYPALDIIINKEEAFNFTNYKSNKFKKMSKRIIINWFLLSTYVIILIGERKMFNENDVKAKMDKAIENLESRFTTVRAGRANPNILNGITIEYYGTPTQLNAISTISVPEARQLMIKPFDKSLLKEIEKAIYAADLGMSPNNNGEVVFLTIPELTEETRKSYVKQVKDMAEEARIALRNIRQDFNNMIKKDELPEDEEKRNLEIVQKLIDKYNQIVEDKFKEKEKELLSIW